ncbi:hypothetical protein GAYE_SCF51G6036 [Galdieria yellowstonensis]|uniref:Uncharacterized protein n=1 Tax=Galdieria yellowstonensis TaxID=3028027 RepID=A0AAV9IKX3_9RHOD|nr:hypothetical protein GAYE_SCF51G6036 [Galdieria yellowstonensis]
MAYIVPVSTSYYFNSPVFSNRTSIKSKSSFVELPCRTFVLCPWVSRGSKTAGKQEIDYGDDEKRLAAVQQCTSKVELDISALEKQFSASDPQEIVDFALSNFGDEVAIAFSGAEDVVLLEYARRTGKPFRVFALDTGRLHPETYRFYEKASQYFKVTIEYQFPNAEEVEALVREKGLFSFYRDGHGECCGIRKVRPLKKKLSCLRAWITGQRKDQSPSTRSFVPTIQIDPTFEGKNGTKLFKFNPLANQSSEQVWSMIRALELPYNELHERGFVSIGCEPCTRPVLPNQHEREGRWWWEEATQKECGLHKGNLSSSGTEAKASQQVDALIKDEPVVVFARSDCPFCKQAKALLDALSIAYKLIEIDKVENGAELLEVLQKRTGQNTVPNIFISQKHIGGWTQLEQLYQKGLLRANSDRQVQLQN